MNTITDPTPPHLRRNASGLALLIAACLLPAGASHAETGELHVSLQGLRDAQGQVRISLYKDGESFRKEDRALSVQTLPAAAGRLEIVFADLAPGRYAVMAYHDENADNRLNLRFGMFPTEGYGLSNNPKVMGPPAFADSAFDFAPPQRDIEIAIRY